MKRWLEAHLMGDALSSEAIELLVCYVYLCDNAPSSSQCGFARTLRLLVEFAWTTSPLVIDLHGDMSAAQRRTAEHTFTRLSAEGWAIVMVMVRDMELSDVTAHGPSPSQLKRIQRLASSTLKHMQRLLDHPLNHSPHCNTAWKVWDTLCVCVCVCVITFLSNSSIDGLQNASFSIRYLHCASSRASASCQRRFVSLSSYQTPFKRHTELETQELSCVEGLNSFSIGGDGTEVKGVY